MIIMAYDNNGIRNDSRQYNIRYEKLRYIFWFFVLFCVILNQAYNIIIYINIFEKKKKSANNLIQTRSDVDKLK